MELQVIPREKEIPVMSTIKDRVRHVSRRTYMSAEGILLCLNCDTI